MQENVQTRNFAVDVNRKKQKKKSGMGLPHSTLNDNAIDDYVHWDDLNDGPTGRSSTIT